MLQDIDIQIGEYTHKYKYVAVSFHKKYRNLLQYLEYEDIVSYMQESIWIALQNKNSGSTLDVDVYRKIRDRFSNLLRGFTTKKKNSLKVSYIDDIDEADLKCKDNFEYLVDINYDLHNCIKGMSRFEQQLCLLHLYYNVPIKYIQKYTKTFHSISSLYGKSTNIKNYIRAKLYNVYAKN
jgi:hypothetical protein